MKPYDSNLDNYEMGTIQVKKKDVKERKERWKNGGKKGEEGKEGQCDQRQAWLCPAMEAVLHSFHFYVIVPRTQGMTIQNT